MNENEILKEIRRVREEHARECNYDVHVMFEQMRAGTEQLKAEGWRIVSPPAAQEPSAVVREDPQQGTIGDLKYDNSAKSLVSTILIILYISTSS